MARHYSHIIAISAVTALLLAGCSGKGGGTNDYTKRERNLIKEGIKHYSDSDFRKADVAFEKALAENPDNPYAQYNSALTRLGLASVMSDAATDSIKIGADSVFLNIAKSPQADTILRENSLYNSGNIAFSREDYRRSIELYKQILRADTANREALENLRLAQLRIPPEDENDQNQNQDHKQDQDQDQQQQNQQQNQQDQNKDQQDQNNDNKDQNQDQNQNQDKQDQNQNNKPKPEDQDKKPQDRQDGSMSAANAQQILDAMEKKEAATRQRVENMKADEERKANANATTLKPW